MNNKFVIIGIFFTLIILSGLWLSRTGRPINVIILTIHKLISLGAVVYLGITVYRIQQITPLTPVEIAVCAVTLLFFIMMFATGGLLSTTKTMPVIVLRIHQIMPVFVILSSSVSLYLLLVRKP